jgi:hypothetical protein
MERLIEVFPGDDLLALHKALAFRDSSVYVSFTRALMRSPRKVLSFDCVIGSIIEVLNADNSCADIAALAYDAVPFSSAPLLGQLRGALKLHLTNFDRPDAFAELVIREAQHLISSQDVRAAKQLVAEELAEDRFNAKVLELYDEVGWVQEKRTRLDRCLANSWTALKSEGASPALLGFLELLHQYCTLNGSSLTHTEQFQTSIQDASDQLVVQVRRQEDQVKQHSAYLEATADSQRALNEQRQMLTEDIWVSPHPRGVYGFVSRTSNLHMMHLDTEEQTTYSVRGHNFKNYFSWCEIPQWKLVVTGGTLDNVFYSSATVIDPSSYFEAKVLPPMLNARASHNSIYYRGCVYVIGGADEGWWRLNKCERYVVSLRKWEAIPSMPFACYDHSLVVLHAKKCLYVVGAQDGQEHNTMVTELNLMNLTWTKLPIVLPSTVKNAALFTTPEICDRFFMVINANLYSISPNTDDLIKVSTVSKKTQSYFGPSIYYRGKLFCNSWYDHPPGYIEVL